MQIDREKEVIVYLELDELRSSKRNPALRISVCETQSCDTWDWTDYWFWFHCW